MGKLQEESYQSEGKEYPEIEVIEIDDKGLLLRGNMQKDTMHSKIVSLISCQDLKRYLTWAWRSKCLAFENACLPRVGQNKFV